MAPPSLDGETTAEELVEHLASEIKDKVILTTGVSPGSLGAHFVRAIAHAQPRLLILAGRTKSKIEETVRAIQADGSTTATRVLELDLASLENVRDAAASVNRHEGSIDVLVNNAGIMASDYHTTVDGFEGQFGTNHLGAWLFTNLIMDKVSSSPGGGRVVNVSSNGYRFSGIRFYDYDFHGSESYNKWRSYGQAKTANILFARALAAKLGSKGLVAVSLHPGVIRTNLSKHLDWEKEYAELIAVDRQNGNWEGWMESFTYRTPSQGVATHIYASFEPTLKDHNGRYLEDCQVVDEDRLYIHAANTRDVGKLWELSEKLTGHKFPY